MQKKIDKFLDFTMNNNDIDGDNDDVDDDILAAAVAAVTPSNIVLRVLQNI